MFIARKASRYKIFTQQKNTDKIHTIQDAVNLEVRHKNCGAPQHIFGQRKKPPEGGSYCFIKNKL